MITSQIEKSSFTETANKYNDVRQYSVNQCKPLFIEDYVPQPVVYISPPKWHLAHTSWFFEEFILKQFHKDYKVFDNDFGYLFNSYYNNVGNRALRADRGNLTRPSVERIYEYRKYVDYHMNQILEEGNNEVLELVELGLNHEQQHQELLLTDLKYILGHNPIFPVYQDGYNLTNHQNSDHGFLVIQEGKYQIGYEDDSFYYDNEKAPHTVFLHEYEISKALVTNKEWIEFIEDDGYSRFDLWLDEGWAWVNEHNLSSPKYWHKINNVWHQYTLSGLMPVKPENIICHISYYEAAAFAEWKNMRLPTEFEWEVASESLKWGSRWEWTNSAYLPYPGFDKPAGAVGEYNGKFMINQMVLRGASSATSPNHSRKTYRNFFHPHYQWQYTGLRLAKRHDL